MGPIRITLTLEWVEHSWRESPSYRRFWTAKHALGTAHIEEWRGKGDWSGMNSTRFRWSLTGGIPFAARTLEEAKAAVLRELLQNLPATPVTTKSEEN